MEADLAFGSHCCYDIELVGEFEEPDEWVSDVDAEVVRNSDSTFSVLDSS